MVFNSGMDTTKTDHPDWALITDLGGPAKVARLLGYESRGGIQRVQNWRYRGIPAEVKIAFPELFLPGFTRRRLRSRPDAARDGEGAKPSGESAGAFA